MQQDLTILKTLPAPNDIKNIILQKSELNTGAPTLDEKIFINAFAHAQLLAPDSETVSGWHYSPWYSIGFESQDGLYQLELYLGGLGILQTPKKTTGAILMQFE